MANNIVANFTTGQTLYFFVFDSNGNVLDGTNLVTFDVNNWQLYAFNFTESATGVYTAVFPSCGPSYYYIVGYQQLGSFPSSSDTRVLFGTIDWNGDTDIYGSGGSTEEQFATGIKDTDISITTGVVGSTVNDGIAIATGVK